MADYQVSRVFDDVFEADSTQVITTWVQVPNANGVRRGHYELAVEAPANQRLAVAFNELAVAI
jgi:hypothetical protein